MGNSFASISDFLFHLKRRTSGFTETDVVYSEGGDDYFDLHAHVQVFPDENEVIAPSNEQFFSELTNSNRQTKDSMLSDLEQLKNTHRLIGLENEESKSALDALRSLSERFETPYSSTHSLSPSTENKNLLSNLQNKIQSVPYGKDPLVCTPSRSYHAEIRSPLPTLEAIQNRILGSIPEKQWPKIRTVVNETSKASILSRLAQSIVNEIPVIVVNGNLALYNERCWKYVDYSEFVTIIRERFWAEKDVLDCLSDSNYREVMMKVKTTPYIIKSAEEIVPDPDLINFRDVTFDLKSNQFIEQSAYHYFFNYIDVSQYEIGQGTGEYFEYFMTHATGGNLDVYTLVLEMLGVIISSKMLKVIFMLLSSSNGGKSQIGKLIQSILGFHNVAVVPSLNAFKKPHTTAILKGKKACLCMDLSRNAIDEDSLSILKQLSGNDAIAIEKKYCDMERLDNTATLIFAANGMPPVDDPVRNDAFYQRLTIIPFVTVPSEMRILDIGERMAEERGYIIGKVLPILQNLRQRNYKLTEVFVDLTEFGELLNPTSSKVQEFYNGFCSEDPESRAFSEDIYALYCTFMDQQNQPPKAIIPFSQEFSKLVPHLRKFHTTRNGKTANGYHCLKLRSL